MKNVSPQNLDALVMHDPSTVANEVSHVYEKPRYDEDHAKDTDAAILGIFLFFIPVMFVIFCGKKGSIFQDATLFAEILISGGVLFRVFACYYVSKVAVELNRNAMNWITIALLAPGSALIAIGCKKKFLEPVRRQTKEQYRTSIA